MTGQIGRCEDKCVRLTTDIDPDQHTRLRIAVAQADTSVREIVAVLLSESLSRIAPGPQASEGNRG